jgi:heat shock protein HslJ
VSRHEAGGFEEENMSRRSLFVVSLPVALLAGACASMDPSTSPSALLPGGDGSVKISASGLEGPTWKLSTLETTAGTPAAVVNGGRFTARFSDGRLEVRADCNLGHASYKAGDSTLSVSLMALTRAYCESAPLDAAYVSALGSARSYSITGSELVVVSERGRLTFKR